MAFKLFSNSFWVLRNTVFTFKKSIIFYFWYGKIEILPPHQHNHLNIMCFLSTPIDSSKYTFFFFNNFKNCLNLSLFLFVFSDGRILIAWVDITVWFILRSIILSLQTFIFLYTLNKKNWVGINSFFTFVLLTYGGSKFASEIGRIALDPPSLSKSNLWSDRRYLKIHL